MVNPYAAPEVSRHLPTLHWREEIPAEDLAQERVLLAAHAADAAVLTADQARARPRPRGLALTLAALGGTAGVVGLGIGALALVLERDRMLLMILAGICGGLAVILAIGARSRLIGDRRHAEDDRRDPVDTLRAYLDALAHGDGDEIVCRLGPGARARSVEAPDLSPHRSHVAYPLDRGEAALAWAKTFARSDPVHPRWLLVRTVDLESQHADLALVRARYELRWWALWGVVLVGGLFLPLLFFALIPGLILYLLLMQRRVVVVTKHLLRGPDQRWYVVRPEIAP